MNHLQYFWLVDGTYDNRNSIKIDYSTYVNYIDIILFAHGEVCNPVTSLSALGHKIFINFYR